MSIKKTDNDEPCDFFFLRSSLLFLGLLLLCACPLPLLDCAQLQDSLILHVFEAGFFSNGHIGDAQIQFNQLVLNQPTPVALAMTQRLGSVIVPGKLYVQVKALDFGHEIVQVAPQQQTFQPHYFVASSTPLSAASSGAPVPLPSSTAVNLGAGQQLYIQPMMSSTAPGVPQSRGIDTSTPMAAMPTANGGYIFYSMPPGAQAPQPIVHNVVPNEPAPSYASLDPSFQYTADFTYEAPSAPTETVVNLPSHSAHQPHLKPDTPISTDLSSSMNKRPRPSSSANHLLLAMDTKTESRSSEMCNSLTN